MSLETTPIGNFNNQQSFRDAFNIADQPIKTPEEKEQFLKLLSELDQSQIIEILIDCNHPDALHILFDKYTYLSNIINLKLALSRTRTKYVDESISNLKYLAEKGQLLISRIIRTPATDESYGCLITSDILDKYLNIYQKSLHYLEKYQKTLSDMIRSSFWHDHGFKYPFPDFKVCLMFQTKDQTELNLVAIMNYAYDGPLKILSNPYLTKTVDFDPETIDGQNFSVYLLGRYYFKNDRWALKHIVKFEKDLKLIKCQTCRQVINEMRTVPEEKLLHKFDQKEICLKCLKKNQVECNLDNYYSDWTPMHLEKWQIPGTNLRFMADQKSLGQVMKESSKVRIIGPFQYQVIIDSDVFNFKEDSNTESKDDLEESKDNLEEDN